MVTQGEYRDAMALLGAAVNLITSDGPGGRTGFTASAVCSVTDAPPTLLVCMSRGSRSNEAFKTNRVLCVNVLAAAHQELSGLFAGPAEMDERFAAVSWDVLETGAPVLPGAAVSFDCRIMQVTEVGTHSVFFCEVEAVRAGTASDAALIYLRRAYHHVAGA